MKSKYTILLILSLASSLSLGTADEKPPHITAEVRKDIALREVYSTKLIIEKDGKEVGRYTAFGSFNPDSKMLYCEGTVALSDTGLWRIQVDADLEASDQADVSIEVEDMKLRGTSEGSVFPQTIFSTQLQSKGIGSYLFGEVQGMTVRVEITKAEQPAHGDAEESE
jgi:hypothetical protein